MHALRSLIRTPYICAQCTRHEVKLSVPLIHNNGTNHFTRRAITSTSRPPIAHPLHPPHPIPHISRYAYSTSTPSRDPLRIAIIGSGPAGFYTAYRLIHKVQDVIVDMYEQLPVPYGLVRFGVAPDHPEVKKCQDLFEDTALMAPFNYIGNVRVGQDVSLAQMKPHYDAMLFSYGASEDRKLGIEGEDLKGVCSAREFVGWYNGLPQFQSLEPELKAGEQAVVIGQGNVALDVARILLTPVDTLRKTDITEQALQTLSESRVKSVRVVGRRGPVQAAFTTKEARELTLIPSVTFESIDRSFYPPHLKTLPRMQRRIGEVLLKGTGVPAQKAPKSCALDFLKAPTSFNASSAHLSSITFATQQFAHDADPFDPSARVVSTGEEISLDASLAFRSVGYKSTALPGLSDRGIPFDTKLGIIPNDIHGRVVSPSLGPGTLTAGHVPGLYCAGWVKCGPTGIIASTMEDAFASADVIAQDWSSESPFLNDSHGDGKSTGLGWEGVKAEVLKKGVRPLSWKDWRRIDDAEKERGKRLGKEREKFASVEDMLGVLDA